MLAMIGTQTQSMGMSSYGSPNIAQTSPEVFRNYNVSPDELAVATAKRCFQDADINQDGIVDSADLGLVLAAWGSSNAACDLDGNTLVERCSCCCL